LTKHLLHIRQAVAAMEPQLRREGKKITIILATDGLPSSDHDENHVQIPEFVQALQSLQSLPVWVVVRLCADDEKIIDFYNSLDAQVQLPCDVLDDLVGKALEVYLRNPWLTYALSLHRLREIGFPHPVMDALDEHALSLSELRALCALLFANHVLPDPALDWTSFLKSLAVAVSRERPQWNPVSKTCSPWIDLVRLHTVYGRNTPIPREILLSQPATNGQHHPTAFPSAPQNQQPPQAFPNSANPPYQQHHHPPTSQQGPWPNNINTSGFTQPPMSQPGGPQFYQQSAQRMPSASHYQSPPAQYHHPQQPNVAYQHQPPQQQPHRQKYAAPPTAPPNQQHQTKYAPSEIAGDRLSMIKNSILKNWGLQPPGYQILRPLDQLLASVQSTFPPVNGVAKHSYFDKFNPFAPTALASRDAAVLKRGNYSSVE
jgi:hypothetical protein